MNTDNRAVELEEKLKDALAEVERLQASRGRMVNALVGVREIAAVEGK